MKEEGETRRRGGGSGEEERLWVPVSKLGPMLGLARTHERLRHEQVLPAFGRLPHLRPGNFQHPVELPTEALVEHCRIYDCAHGRVAGVLVFPCAASLCVHRNGEKIGKMFHEQLHCPVPFRLRGVWCVAVVVPQLFQCLSHFGAAMQSHDVLQRARGVPHKQIAGSGLGGFSHRLIFVLGALRRRVVLQSSLS